VTTGFAKGCETAYKTKAARPRRPARLAPERAATLLPPPEAVMVDGVAVAETLAEVVPTEPALVDVVLAKAGALVGTEQVLQYTTLEVVTGLTIVQGQSVMVRVVASLTV